MNRFFEVVRRSEETFDNFNEIYHPMLELDEDLVDEFIGMMEAAIARGTPLTPAELKAKFGEISWDW